MTTTVFLVRHVPHEHQGRIQVGRRDGVRVPEGSRPLLDALARRFEREDLAAVHASPIERARVTAEAVARSSGLSVQVDEDLTEMDFGDWTGMSFDALEAEPSFQDWNRSKSTTRAPGGESSTEVQARMVRAIERARLDGPDRKVALVSHGDPIKTAIAWLLGLGPDGMHRFEVDPGSITTAVVGDWGAKVLTLNERPA